MRHRIHALVLVCSVALCSTRAFAQAQTTAPTQHTEHVTEAAPTTDSQDWTASFGAVVNTGNTKSWAMSGGTSFAITRGRHGFKFESVGNFARAVPQGDTVYRTSARNLVTRGRYEIFITNNHAAFASLVHRWDTFAGLDTRIQAQAGYQYNFIREEKHRLWAEVGYDFTWDNEHTMMPQDVRVSYHSVRLYAGWDIHTSDYVAFKTGLEALFNVETGTDYRFNWENTLTSRISNKLSVELKFNLYYDHQPVPGRQTTDTRTIVNLVLDMW